ncbi:MAG TPA: NOP5/NOP56 family protein [Candidatus Thermoplasmatota archaeon]|nr:NOP5/NOP56 family protein [Candidatus Thermoplasmatota archaeon]
MQRPAWFDKGSDVAAVAAHLEALSKAPGPLRFEAVQVPAGTDLLVLHQAALTLARRKLSLSNTEGDRILAQEVRAIDDLVRTANLLVERLREWYALHAPEATRLVTDAETLAKLVSEKGDRTTVMAAIDQAKMAESSLGSDLDPADLTVLRGFAAALAAVHDSWHALEARVQELMVTVAPNLGHVVGPVLGARMIALSGGLNRMATWPAGTVQLLGAETALFRHIKEGTKPPKHGILFQHPQVHLAPPWQRGPIARILALAAAKAAKADAFTKNDLRPFLTEEVKKGIERIQRERPRPPVRKAPGYLRNQGPGARRGPGERRAPARPYTPAAPAPRFGERRDAPRSEPPRYGNTPRPTDGQGGFNRGPPRESFGGGARDGPQGGGGSGPRGPPRDDRPWKRKPQGAFRSDNAPARPPGSASKPAPKDGKPKKDPTQEGF